MERCVRSLPQKRADQRPAYFGAVDGFVGDATAVRPADRRAALAALGAGERRDRQSRRARQDREHPAPRRRCETARPRRRFEHAARQELVDDHRHDRAPRAMFAREALVADRLQAVQVIRHQPKDRRCLGSSPVRPVACHLPFPRSPRPADRLPGTLREGPTCLRSIKGSESLIQQGVDPSRVRVLGPSWGQDQGLCPLERDQGL